MRLFLPVLLASFCACAAASTAQTVQTAPLVVDLQQREQSEALSGTATIAPDATGTGVTIVITAKIRSGDEANLVHGTCDRLGDIAQSLSRVVSTRSRTHVDIALADLVKGPYAIDVLRSALIPAPRATHNDILCGNIVAK